MRSSSPPGGEIHTAISSLDIRKMDDVWPHEPYAMAVNPRDKTVTVGWDAIRKNFEGGVFAANGHLIATSGQAAVNQPKALGLTVPPGVARAHRRGDGASSCPVQNGFQVAVGVNLR